MSSGSAAARREVSEWLKKQTDEPGAVGRVEIDHVKEEERRIVLKANNGEAFSVQYQMDYPASADEYLFVETESKIPDFVAVINDLRDFVYGQPPSLTVAALLDQLKRFLVKKSVKKERGPAASEAAVGAGGGGSVQRWGGSGGGGGGDDDVGDAGYDDDDDDYELGDDNGEAQMGEDDDDDGDGNESDYVYEDDEDEEGGGGGADGPQMVESTWLDEHYKKRNWQDKERALREEMAANKALKAKEDAKGDNKRGQKKVENIFTSRASSGVLTKDLLDIQRREQELGMEVQAVDDNIFHWKVKINRVSESSPLCDDLRQLRSKFAYGYVEMELTFTMDLYPFYPPLVKLVRPRFQGFMMGRITSLEMLQLSKWSSVRGMKSVLLGVRTALETWGRLDLNSELNDVIVHPEGSYTELEHLLMRLGLVTEIRPHATAEYDEKALWKAVGKEEEAQDKARRHWGQEKASESAERKRKRPAVAATGLGATTDDDDNNDDMDQNASGTDSGGGGVSGMGAWMGSGVGSGAGGPVPMTKAQVTAATSQAKKVASGVAGAKAEVKSLVSDGAVTVTGPEGSLLPPSGVEMGDSMVAPAMVVAGVGAVAAGGDAGGGGGGRGVGSGVKKSETTKWQPVAKPTVVAGNPGGGNRQGGKQYWAAGTGYGHSGAAGEKWDVEAYLAAQREQDRLKEDLLEEIAYLMRPDDRESFAESGIRQMSCSSNKDDSAAGVVESSGIPEKTRKGKGMLKAAAAAAAASARKFVSKDSGTAGGSDAAALEVDRMHIDSSGRRRKRLTRSQEEYRVTSVNASLRVLEESCLIPFLQQLLENDSLLDVDRHASLYTAVFKLVKCITSWRSLRPLLCPMKGQAPGKSLYRLLSRLGDRAKVYRSTTLKGCGGKGKWKGGSAANNLHFKAPKGAANKAFEGTISEDQGALTDLLLAAVQQVEEVVDTSTVEELEKASITRPMETRGSEASTAAGGGGGSGAASGGGGGGRARGRGRGVRGERAEEGGEEKEGEEDWRKYRECMGPLQYVELEDLAGFSYKKDSNASPFRNNVQRVKRLGQEHADLSQSLPLSISSSVFVRTHEDQMDWMQVIISGPDDTPYSGGLFAFDIFFPHNYPNVPPKVKLVTTGGGQHRFNPNLYADGKVCLSLLGTWDGDRGENWNAATSTLLQVLVSVQSLILVPEPFFNEPGYERQLGTDQGKQHSWDYNAKQREGTVQLAMIEQLQRPPDGFEDVVRGHFYHRKRYLERLMDQYVKEAKGKDRQSPSQHYVKIQSLATQLKAELKALSPPESQS